MNKDRLKRYKERFENNPSLANWADLESLTIWQKIEYCRLITKFNLHENTITQDLIYSFWQFAATRELPVLFYQSKNEKANGNDLEIAIETYQGYILFPCQAKVINEQGRYPKISHKVSGVSQVDILIEYAKKLGGFPIYFFYNFGTDHIGNETIERSNRLDIEQFGCSIFPARFLKHYYQNFGGRRWTIPDFYGLHYRLAIPFSALFNRDIETSILKKDPESHSIRPQFYTQKALSNPEIWKHVFPGASIGRIEERGPYGNNFLEEKGQELQFTPAFRVLFPLKLQSTVIISN